MVSHELQESLTCQQRRFMAGRSVMKLGVEGLSKGAKTAVELELAQLKRENNELKKLVAEKELAIRVKDSLLKKAAFETRKNNGRGRF